MNYKELIVWQKAFLLAKLIYKLTESFPEKERYSLTDQIRRCAVSVPSNIAEGYGRATKKHFNNFLRISLGSISELETQILLAKEIGYINQNLSEINSLIYEIQKIIGSIISKP